MAFPYGADLVLAGMAPPSGSGSGAWITQVLFFGAIFAIFYFLLIRPQQKQKADRQRMLDGLKRGDRVVTASGLHGTITALNEQTITLRVTDQVKLEFDRAAIGRVIATPTSDKDA
jgi:preprotein translocase subunit YajC